MIEFQQLTSVLRDHPQYNLPKKLSLQPVTYRVRVPQMLCVGPLSLNFNYMNPHGKPGKPVQLLRNSLPYSTRHYWQVLYPGDVLFLISFTGIVNPYWYSLSIQSGTRLLYTSSYFQIGKDMGREESEFWEWDPKRPVLTTHS